MNVPGNASCKIDRWGVFLFKNSVTEMPSVYITPDESLLKYLTKEGMVARIKITGTGKGYDNNEYFAVCYKSQNVPNCRPNYFNQSGQYCVVLYAPWFGYPIRDLGKIEFLDLPEKIEHYNFQIPSKKK